MLSKKFTPKRTVCKVTFTMPANVAKEQVAIAGDFNDWNPADHLLEKKKDTYQIELRLKPEQSYRFKYLIDNELWENDYAADEYIPNEFGAEDSVVIIGN